MPKRLNDQELEELKTWLKDQKLNIGITKMCREFSDAVPVANLLKKFNPKLIDLHNYPPRNNTQLKLDNWQTLNQKVLSKLGLHQNKNMLQKLAKGTTGAIESLLYDIMVQEKANRIKEDNRIYDDKEQIWSENDEVMMITISKKIGDAIVQVPQKMILYSIYEQTLRESHTKDSYLNVAQQKVAHLENILKLKSERIDELCVQLAKLSVRTLMRQHNLENSNSGTDRNDDHLENNEQSSKSSDF